jgi:lysophospholipase L1-like esterase
LPNYAAVGASEAVGIGASVPCGVIRSLLPGCPGGTSYAPILSRNKYDWLGFLYLRDLGISGAVISPTIQTLLNQTGTAPYDTCTQRTGNDRVLFSLLGDEVSRIPGRTDQITFFAGPNDAVGLVNALGCGAGGTDAASQTAFVQKYVLQFQADLIVLAAGLRAKAPTAVIAAANVPDLSRLPFAAPYSQAAKAALQAFSLGFDGSIDALAMSGIRVVDLLCDPPGTGAYDPTNFSADGFHPNNKGYAALAQRFQAVLTATAPSTPQPSCSQRSAQNVMPFVPMQHETLPNPDPQPGP